MCVPGIHPLFKAAGIKDVSVKIWDSRDKINVMKAAVRVLHVGHVLLAMGNGIGSEGM
jgi:small subunit ribosomal protein S5